MGCRSSGKASSAQSTEEIPFVGPREPKGSKGKPCVSLLCFALLSGCLPCFPRSIALPLNSVCCCQSEEQPVKMRLLLLCVQVCFPQCMCASPSSALRGRQRTSALNSPLTPPPPLSLRPSSPPPFLPPSLLSSPLSADINTQGTCAKIPGKVVRILGGH